MRSLFFETQGGFSARNAVTCADLSDLAYNDPTTNEAELRLSGFTDFRPVYSQKTNAHAFVARRAGVVVVVCRGTKDFRDFVADANCFLRPLTSGKRAARVHAGFNEQYVSIINAIVEAIVAFKRDSDVIVVCGHSLGGALAVLVGLYLANFEPFYKLHSVYTYGQPYVGDRRFARLCNRKLGRRHIRVVDETDIVPRSPRFAFRLPVKLMWHSGDERFITNRLKLRRNPSLWIRLVSDVLAAAYDLDHFKASFLDDHHAGLYCSRLRLALGL